MANNALIRGAAEASKKFLDIGGAVAAGINATPDYVPPKNNRVAENKAIQAKVNNYMGKMKTDMDFTSFNPAETATMRNFLLSQRTIYTDAAKKAAEFDDTTDPDYMLYVDQMQNVNNSFTNLAAQLKSYKKSKLEYASNMQEGLYSNGNPGAKSKEAAIIYGFYDADGDNRSEDKYDAPFQIQEGGNIAFNVGGQEISYNGMEEPFLKDTKFLNSLNATAEKAYNSGLRGNTDNKYAQDAYEQQLNDTLQNEDALRSIIFDFKAEADLSFIGDKLENGTIDIEQARTDVMKALTKARKDAYTAGKNQYNAKQEKIADLANPNILDAKKAAEFKLSQGLGDVDLYHPSQPNAKQKFNIRPTENGGYEIALKGGNVYSPLEADNVYKIDITKINLGSPGEDDDIGFNQKLYDDIKATLGIKGDPTPEQDKKIMVEYDRI